MDGRTRCANNLAIDPHDRADDDSINVSRESNHRVRGVLRSSRENRAVVGQGELGNFPPKLKINSPSYIQIIGNKLKWRLFYALSSGLYYPRPVSTESH